MSAPPIDVARAAVVEVQRRLAAEERALCAENRSAFVAHFEGLEETPQ